MNYIERTQRSVLLPFILIVSVTLNAYSLKIGFSLKPYMVLCALIFLFSLYRFEIHKLKLYEVIMLVFYTYYCSTGLFAKYNEHSIRLIGAILINLSCYFIMRYTFSRLSITNLEKLISRAGILFNFFSLALYVIGAYTLDFNFSGNAIRAYGLLIDRGIPRLVGTFTDPNIFAFGNLIFFYYYLTHLREKESKLGILLSTTTLLLTFSRGAVLAIFFGILIIFISAKPRDKIKMSLFCFISIYILIHITRSLLSIDIVQIVVNRFGKIFEDNATGRLDLWMNSIEFFVDSPFWGIGIYNYRPYSREIFNVDNYMHNTFLEVLIESGIIGFLMYSLIFLILLYVFYKYRNIRNESRYLFYTLCSMIVLMNSLSLVVNECFFMFLAVVWRYFKEKGRLVNE